MNKKENKKISFALIISIILFQFYATSPFLLHADETLIEEAGDAPVSSVASEIQFLETEIPETTSTNETSTLEILSTSTPTTEQNGDTSSSSTENEIPLLETEIPETVSTGETSTTSEILYSATSSESTSTPPQVILSEEEVINDTQLGSTTNEEVLNNVIPSASSTDDVSSSTIPTEIPVYSTSTDNSSTTVSLPDFISLGTSTLATTTIITGPSTHENLTTATDTELITINDDEANEDDSDIGPLPAGTTTIRTGAAISTANILNILNTNLINSSGSIMMANMTDGYDGELDLRNFASSGFGSGCTLLACNGIDSITAKIEADASINNTIDLLATTGSNTIDTAETGIISTGRADAGLNLVNVANTNFIDSNYLLLSLNSFNTINGDIIFPSLSSFFSAPNSDHSLSNLNILQNGTTLNNLDVNANSGNNGTDALNGMIYTGNTNSSINIYNNMGTTLIGGNSVSVLLKVSKTWLGKIFGLPNGNIFTEDGNTRTLHMEDGSPALGNETTVNTINSTSTANINNDVKVLADTGNNTTAMTGTSRIDTGDSRAAANVINIANTNVIGRNWVLAIINIFGDFNGNIAFGRPDLWLGEQVTADSVVQNGTNLTYKLTIINKGDSNASESRVSMSYDDAHLEIINSSIPFTKDESNNLLFEVGLLAPTDTKEIILQARIKDTTPGMAIVNTSTVTELETDNNLADNTDSTTITTWVASSGGGGGGGGGGWFTPSTPQTSTTNTTASGPATTAGGASVSINQLTVAVSRVTASTTIVGMGTKGEQIIIIRNLSNSPMSSITFDDILYDQNGKEVQIEKWDLGTILPNEEITLSYKLYFDNLAQPGTFSLSSKLHQSNELSLVYNNNGFITYIIPVESPNISPYTSTARTLTTAPELTHSEVVVTPQKTIVRVSPEKGKVLGVFTGALLPEVVYAQSTGLGLSTTNNIVRLFIYVMSLLGILVIRKLWR